MWPELDRMLTGNWPKMNLNWTQVQTSLKSQISQTHDVTKGDFPFSIRDILNEYIFNESYIMTHIFDS